MAEPEKETDEKPQPIDVSSNEPNAEPKQGGWATKKAEHGAERQEHWTKRAQAERDAIRAELETERKLRDEDRKAGERAAIEAAELRGRMAAQEAYQRQQAQATPAADPDEDRYQKLASRRVDSYAKNDWDGAQEAEQEMYKIIARREFREQQKLLPQAQHQDPSVAIVQSEFPWLVSNSNAQRAAAGFENVLLAQGKPAGIETMREACRMTAQQLNLSGGPRGQLAPTTNAQRQLYGGSPPSRDVGTQRKTSIVPTKDEIAMAQRLDIPIEELMKTRARNNPDRLE